MASLKDIISSHSPVLQVALSFQYLKNDLACGAKSEVLPADLGLSMPFCFFSEDLGFLTA